jgi:glutathione S-transferase
VKVESYLRMRGIPFMSVTELNPRRGPKGKMPVIDHEGTIVPDSGFIVEYLMRRYGPGPDGRLSMHDRGAAHAYRRLVEESLYWTILHSRWVDERGWRCIQRDFAPLFPWRSGRLALRLIRRELLRQAWSQGSGRHSSDEIYGQAAQDLESLAEYLGEKEFFTGSEPVSFDATFFAFLATILAAPYETPLQRATRSHPNLVSYCARMRRHCLQSSSVAAITTTSSTESNTSGPPLSALSFHSPYPRKSDVSQSQE